MGGPAKAFGKYAFAPTAIPYWAARGGFAAGQLADNKLNGGGIGKALSPSAPGVTPPPAPPDEVAAMLQEYSRSATERRIKQGKGRSSFLSLDPAGEPYRAPGSKMTTGA